MWNRACFHPPDIDDLRPEVWNEEGVIILGTPFGSDRFVDVASTKGLKEERRL